MLEDRIAPSVFWTGAGDGASWSDPHNWNTGTLPGATDDVIINLAGAKVTYSTGTTTVNSITDSDTLVLAGGSLTTNAGVQVNQVLTMSGTALTANGGVSVNAATLNFNSGTITIPNSGAVTFTGNSALIFANTATGGGNFAVTAGTTSLQGAVPAAATVTIGTGANALIPRAQTLTVNGALNVNAANSFLIDDNNWDNPFGIVVNGTMTATGTTFSRLNGTNGNDTAYIQAASAGHITASNCVFGWDQFSLANGSVLNSGDLTGNGFDTTVLTPAADVPLLTNNLRFQDVDINGGSLASGTSTLGLMGTVSTANLRYVFVGNFSVATGATLNVTSGVNVLVARAITVTVNGTFNVTGANSFQIDDNNWDNPFGIVVNGTMAISGTPFGRLNGSNGNDTVYLQAASGGHITASNSAFGWDQFILSNGSVLNSGDLTGNGFDTTVFTPAADVPLLTNNLRFQDVDINGGSLASGTSTLGLMGTATTANLRYVFVGNFSVATGATLNVTSGVNVLVARTITVTINGTFNVTSANSFAIDDNNWDNPFGIVVNGTLNATGTTFSRFNGSNGNDTVYLQAASGGHITASNCVFGWDQFVLSNGSVLNSGDLTGNGFDTTVFTPAAYVPLLTNNLRFGDVNINGGSLASGTSTLGLMGTVSTANLRYVFVGNFTVAAGATLNVTSGVNVLVARTITVTISGTFNVTNANSFQIDDNNWDNPFGIVVNGTLNTTGTTFSRFNGANGNDTVYLQAVSGGHITASNCVFGWDQFSLANGSVLNSGDLTGNGFDTTVFTPAAYVPLLTNNLRFQDVDINAGSLASGTSTFGLMGTASTANLRYVFVGNFSVATGATLNITSGVNVLLARTITVTVNGTFNVTSANSFAIDDNNWDNPFGIVVNGTMTATGTTFSRLNGANGNDTVYLQAASGGHITASNCVFGWDQFSLSNGSVLNSGDLTGNGFDTTVFTPAAYVPLLTNNLRFGDVDINGGSLASGTSTFGLMGTATTANLRYVFVGNFSVATGATLNVTSGVNVLVARTITVTINGTFNVTSANSFAIDDNNWDNPFGIVVNGTLNATGTTFSRFNGSNGNDTVYLQAASGGHITASNCVFGWDQFSLSNGSVLNSGDLTGNGFDTTVFTPAAYVPLLTNNLRFGDVNINGGSLASGTSTFGLMGTASTANLRYVFVGNFSVATGATLNVTSGVNVLVARAITVTINGTFNVTSANSFAIDDNNWDNPFGIVVNGTLNATGTTFSRFNGSNGNDTVYLQAASGGHITASNCVFGWDQFSLSNGSVLNSGDLTGNGFDTTVFTPAAYVPLLTNNLRFQDVNINGGSLASGTVHFTPMGTASTANLRYVFVGNFSIASGATLSLDSGINALLARTITLTVNGTLNTTGDSFAVDDNNWDNPFGIVVNGTLNASGTTFGRLNGTNGNDTTSIQATSGGKITASNSVFGWDNVTLASGSTDNLQFVAFPTQLAINSGSTLAATSNDFSSASTNIVATGSSSSTIDLRNNYWGTTDTSKIAAKILDHTTDSTRPTVLYLPILNEAPADITGANAAVSYNAAAQNVTLTAAVTSPSGVVNEGSVTFSVMNGSTLIGTAITVNVSNGAASASYALPAGLAGGTYTLQDVYNGTANFFGGTDSSHVLTVGAAPTTTTGSNASVTYDAVAQAVPLSATVTSVAGTVNEGTATFTILNGASVVGTATTVNVLAGAANASYTLPAGTLPGSYTIQVAFNGTADFLGSSDSSHALTVQSPPAPTVVVGLDASSNTGAPDHPGFTHDATPTFDVQVNEGGTITIDFDGNGTTDQTLSVTAAGTYQLTAPALSDGSYTATANFDAGEAGTTQNTTSYTIDTATPSVSAVTPTGTLSARVSTVTVTFSEPVDLATFTASAVALAGPNGAISVNAPQLVSGSTYNITFAAQSTPGTYTLTIAASVTNYAATPMAQPFNSSFAIALPDLSLSAASAPASTSEGVSLPVSWQVTNINPTNAAGSAWNDAVYLSTKNTLDNNAIRLRSVAAPAPPLAPNSSYTRNVSVPVPGNVATGNYYLLFVANDNAGQLESDAGNDTNDVMAQPITLLAPDLQVSGVSGPVHGYTGQTVLLTWTDANNGNATATGPWVDNVYTVTDAQGDNPVLVGSFTFSGSLAVGATAARTQQVVLPDRAGTQWILVQTNAGGTVPEGTNYNNDTAVSAGSVAVANVPLPDLVVSNLTPPPNGVLSGNTVPISFTVTNQGRAPTLVPTWYDWVILSQDPTLSQTYLGQLNGTGPGGDQLLNNQPIVAGFANASYLDVGESYHQTVNVQLPINAQGTWYVYVVPDGTGAHHPFAMPEMSRTDKLAVSAPFSVTLSPPPDLAVTSVTAPAQNFSGQPMRLTWTVANNGTGPTAASAWTDKVYMSPNATLDGSATLLGTFAHQGALAAGSSYTSSETLTLPVGVSGSFYFLVQTDANGQVFENGATANNIAASTIKTVNLTPPPDLTISAITLPASAQAGHGLAVSYTVTNAGAGPTPNFTWNDALYLSPTATFNAATAISLGRQTHQGSLAAGGTYTNSVTVSVPNGLTGTYYLLVNTDTGHAVFELNQANNWGASSGTTQVTSAPPDLVVTAITVPAQVLPGALARIGWTVTNQGGGDTASNSWQDAVYVDTGSTLSSNGILLGTFDHYGVLAAGASYSQTQTVRLPINLLGAYNFFVVANASDTVYQPNANNTSGPASSTITLQIQDDNGNTEHAAVSDLQMTALTGPSTASTGGSIAVNWTVKNNGTGSTDFNYWNDDVWLSNNTTLGVPGGTDVYLGTVEHTNPLAAGSTYSASGTFTLPQAMAGGNYYVIVATDRPVAPPSTGLGVNLVYESNEANNQRAASGTTAVTVSAAPDLATTNITVPASATSGQTLTVGWTVTNNGAATGNVSITDSVYLSLDPYLDATDRYLGSVSYSGGLASGASYNQSASFVLPAGLAGTYSVFVVDNSDHAIYELNPTDGVAISAQPVVINLPEAADLVAGTVTVPANGLAGQNISLTYQVTNNGGSPANGAWYDSLYLSATPTWSPAAQLLGRVYQNQNLAPGGSYAGSLTATLPGVAPGSYYILLRTNIFNSVPEVTQDNNLSASLTRVTLDATAITLGTTKSGTLNQGQSAYYKVTVAAGQTLQFTLTGTAPAHNELYVSYGTMPTRAHYDARFSQPFSANQQITIANTQAGNYYILIYGSDVSTPPESYKIKAALVPFSVQAATPTQIGTGPVTLKITGALFNFSTVFQLRTSSGATINASRTLLADAATAYVTFDLTGQAVGSYYVWAIQSDGTSVKLATAIQAVAATSNDVQVGLLVPSGVLVGRPGTITITYSNPGNTDLPAPLLILTGQNALFQTPGQSSYDRSTVELLGGNPSGPFGTLPPGFEGSITLSYMPVTVGTGVQSQFTVSTPHDASQPFDWNAVTTSDIPLNTSPQQWAGMVQNAAALMGSTWGSVLSFLRTNSIQLQEAPDGGPTAAPTDSQYNFAALLQYAVGVYGAETSATTTPPYPSLASEGEVTVYNAHLDGSGNAIAPNPSWPTYVLVPGLHGYRSDFAALAQAIGADSNAFPGGQVNILLATWQGAASAVPWLATLHVNTAGAQLGDLLGALQQQNLISTSSTSAIGDDLGSYVASAAAQRVVGGLATGLALNPASAWSGYEPPDMRPDFQTSIALETTSLFDTQLCIAASTETLATGDLNDPVAQHLFGVSWLAQQIQAGYDALLTGSQMESCILPVGNDPLPPLPVLDDITIQTVMQINPHDPNNVIGPQGCGSNQYVSNTQPLSYQVTFQNQPSANAPAQQVIVRQPLDPNLDWGSFRLGSFGFGGQVYQVPANSAYYQTQLDLTATLGFDVDVTATVDESAGVATWIFTTINPTTGVAPNDATIGFLPPDNGSGIGDGFVGYTILPQQSTQTGTVITAQATVTFDTQPPLNTARFFNTIDTGAGLSSSVTALPTYETATTFNVSWSGTDAPNSSGIQNYTIYVSDNGGPYTAWLRNTTLTSAPFTGAFGHTYRFYSQATDNVFNVEPAPTSPDTQTLVTSNPQPVLTVAAPTSSNAGTAFTITVTARDAGGNILTGYTGTVHFTSSDKKAVLPKDYIFTATDAGKHVFKITLKTAGPQTVTATDTANANLTVTTPTITVKPGVAKKFVLTTFSSAPVAGTAYSITVTADDAYGNVATGYRGTVHFSVTDTNPLVVLPADYTFTATDSGVHTFPSSITLITAGPQTLTVADTTTTTIMAIKKVTVKAAAVAALVVTGFPSPATAGTAYSFTVEAVDKYNNQQTTYRGTVHFTSSDLTAQLPANYVFTSLDKGLHTFSATLNTVSTGQSLTATDIKTSKITGSETGIQVVAPAGVLSPALLSPLEPAGSGTTPAPLTGSRDRLLRTLDLRGLAGANETDNGVLEPALVDSLFAERFTDEGSWQDLGPWAPLVDFAVQPFDASASSFI